MAGGRAARGAAPLAAGVAPGESLVGGGTFPGVRLPAAVLRIEAGDEAEAWMAELRAHDPPVVARGRKGRILIDLRAVAPEEDAVVASALISLGQTGGEVR